MSTGRLGAGDTAIQPTIVDAKGDLIVGVSADTVARLAVGATNGHALVVDSSTSTGLKYAAVGKVLQVVNATYSTEVASSSSTYADTGLTASITPSATSSKILIILYQSGLYRSSGQLTNAVNFKLMRGATDLYTVEKWAAYDSATYNNANVGGSGITYLDSPSSTSSVTYKTQFKNNGGSNAEVRVQHDNVTSSITLMEIAG